MNYKHFEIFPRKGINLIFGPNGSGKVLTYIYVYYIKQSSILVAIKLLLGSTPEDCKRGNEYKAYVNNKISNGESSKIELCIHDDRYCSAIRHKDKTVYFLLMQLIQQKHYYLCCTSIKLDLLTHEHILCNNNEEYKGREVITNYLRDEYNIDSNNIFQMLQQETVSEVLSENLSKNLMNIERSINYKLVLHIINFLLIFIFIV